ncbi:hypothetical protein QYS48_14895 [Marivirga arenosa]|uniref:Uncharacterized protein n=1 Tax=Marivirga arenosa TaxID=3059076 RepID=A0AA49GE88_9BACT|nr:hypothetical protein [Marivirga sp. ABR2-2]WKK83586.2 hypothetical protein QYS48_14895 [Marivirga sp. ABR2-2]
MNRLSFNIIPSPESNDHQVRILIDNEDWLHDDYLGIDPPRFFQQETFLSGDLLVGRCDCGVEGCGDLIVNVHSDKDKMIWTNNDGLKLQFDKTEYSKVIEFSKTDFKWEDINRRVERLMTNIFNASQTIDGLTFDWASCRIENKRVNLSYSKKGLPEDFKQEILKFAWDGKSESNAIDNAEKFLQTNKRLKR